MTTKQPGASPILDQCKKAHQLVDAFLSDTLPQEHLHQSTPRYVALSQRRQIVKDKVRKSLEVLHKSLELHDLSEVAVSYNGGKDCLVMLMLLMSAIYTKMGGASEESLAEYSLDSIYINSEQPFPALAEFIDTSAKKYGLNLITVKSQMKDGFEHYLSSINPKIKAIVVGIRYADPYGSQLEYEQETDHNWPKFVRIHPILHWHYCDIWDFIMACNLEYCSLYDQGYTSLGGVDSTVPNVFLKTHSATGPAYLPAYMLEEHADERERVGRTKK